MYFKSVAMKNVKFKTYIWMYEYLTQKKIQHNKTKVKN